MAGFSTQGKGLGVTVGQEAQRRAERLKWLGGRSAQAAAADEQQVSSLGFRVEDARV